MKQRLKSFNGKKIAIIIGLTSCFILLTVQFRFLANPAAAEAAFKTVAGDVTVTVESEDAVLVSLTESSQVAEEYTLFLPLFTEANTANCRFGVNLNTLGSGGQRELSNYDLSALDTGWYINYSATPATDVPANLEHAPMIRLRQLTTTTYTYEPGKDSLISLAEANPGGHWFIGNEPDRIKYQDSVEPAVYAEAYHELYELLKGVDPTAQIVAGSIVQPTEIRLEYLDKILESYSSKFDVPMPVDAWSIHNFILNEASCDHFNDLSICWGADIPPGVDAVEGLRIGIDQHHDIELFKEQIVRFRNWMNTNGYNGKPVYLSEYGVLLPDWYRPAVDFSPERVNQFMTASFDFVLNEKDETLGNPADDYRLVQRLSWYSVNDDYRAGTPYSYNGNLFDPRTFERSEMGDNYAAYTRALAPEVDLLPISLQSVSIQKPGSTNVFSVTLSAQIANSGNQNHDQRAMVTFFNGDPLTTGKQIGESLPIAISGCGETAKAEYMWKSVATGTYKIYVQVDSNNSVAESNEENNLLSTEISVTRGTSTSP